MPARDPRRFLVALGLPGAMFAVLPTQAMAHDPYTTWKRPDTGDQLSRLDTGGLR